MAAFVGYLTEIVQNKHFFKANYTRSFMLRTKSLGVIKLGTHVKDFIRGIKGDDIFIFDH